MTTEARILIKAAINGKFAVSAAGGPTVGMVVPTGDGNGWQALDGAGVVVGEFGTAAEAAYQLVVEASR